MVHFPVRNLTCRFITLIAPIIPIISVTAARGGAMGQDRSPVVERGGAINKTYYDALTPIINRRASPTPPDRHELKEALRQAILPAARDLLALALEFPTDPDVVAVLGNILTVDTINLSPERHRALAILARDHAADRRIGLFVPVPSGATDPAHEDPLLRAVIDRNPDRALRAEATLALGRSLQKQADLAERMEADPAYPGLDDTDWVGGPDNEYFDPASRDDLRRRGSAAIRADARSTLKRVRAEFGDVDDGKLARQAAEALDELDRLAIGQPAPAIDGTDGAGAPLKLSDLRGRVVVLTFVAHKYGASRPLLPQLKALASQYRDRPFTLVSVSVDADQGLMDQAIERGEIGGRYWWDGGPDHPIQTDYHVAGTPAVVVIDAGGIIRAKNIKGRRLDEVVAGLLAH